MEQQHGYIAYYNGKKIEIHAPSLYAAKQEAVKQFNVPKKKEYLVSVMLAEKNGQPVIHDPGEL